MPRQMRPRGIVIPAGFSATKALILCDELTAGLACLAAAAHLAAEAGDLAMGRAPQNNIDETREITESPPLQDQLASILKAIEAEPVPENLRKLATELQTMLEQRLQRGTSN